jgi:protocatechuate 4,5-dioxygenase alpha chain
MEARRASTAPPIAGTTLFDGQQARKGYALNKMCFSFNSADARAEFRRDEDAYMRKYNLNAQQSEAIRKRDVLGLLAAGGNVYYLAKFAGILGLDVQDLGAAQTGMSKEAFKARLVAQNQQPDTWAAEPAGK